MKYILTCLILVSLSLCAEDLEMDFLKSLDEVSEIATKTKLNIDDTPSFVTVLQNEELKQVGVKNVFEALGLVPGVQLKRELSGVPVVVFRGVTQKGEVKLMVDGVTINNSYRASIYYYLNFPIELIDRIEVIRGAGSVLYGSNAISGVINIITKNSQEDARNNFFISTGTYKNNKIGTLLSTTINDIKLSVDSYSQRNRKEIRVNSNPSGMFGDSDRHLNDSALGINISTESISFNGRIKKSDIGNAYGILGILDTQRSKFYNENRSIFAELSYKGDINLENSIKIALGYTNYKQKAEASHPTGADILSNYEEKTYFSELNILSKSIDNNRLLIGLRLEASDELKNDWDVNGIASVNPIVNSNFYREVSSIYLNDEYSINQDTDISAGIRYDHYSDFKNSLSPNLGLVYKIIDELRLKALYSHSFRAPSWIELTSNDSLKAEKSDTLETGVVFKYSPYNILRVNFYATKIDDMITKDPVTRKYIQKTKNTFYGSELEYSYIPTNDIQVNFMASYVDAKDNDGNILPNVASILASTNLTYELPSGFVFGTLLRYVSGSKRFDNDTRGHMAESLILNQTISYSYKDFTASLVLNDLFDANTYYSTTPNRYNQDFDDGGRNMMLNMSLKF